MRYKPILLVVLLVLGLNQTNAQNDFAPIGTTWYYETEDCAGGSPEDCRGYIKYEAVRDTLVLGQSCRIIEGTVYAGTEIFYEFQEVVYGRKPNRKSLLV